MLKLSSSAKAPRSWLMVSGIIQGMQQTADKHIAAKANKYSTGITEESIKSSIKNVIDSSQRYIKNK